MEIQKSKTHMNDGKDVQSSSFNVLILSSMLLPIYIASYSYCKDHQRIKGARSKTKKRGNL